MVVLTCTLYSVRVELSPSLKKRCCTIECKVRYYLTYFIHLALKYILILFITLSRECYANRHVFPRVREDTKAKRLRLQTKEVVANFYDYFEELHRHQCIQGPLKRTADATVPASFVKRFFIEPWPLYSCLKL